jgi:hypothetical protein
MAHKLSSIYLINQGNTGIKKPNATKSAFTDADFYKNCGKTDAVGTIKDNGCAICTLAMFILYKGGLPNENNNTYYAVEEATKKGTNQAADCTHSGFTATIGSKSISVNIAAIADLAAEIQSGGVCMARLKQGSNSHYFIIDGWDGTKSGFARYLVCDPDGGAQKSLADTMSRRGFTADAVYLVGKYKLS